MIEKEIKTMLTEGQYEKLKDLFSWDEKIEQVNHYYANSDTDSGKKLTIRVRDKAGRHFLQIKRPGSEESSLHISEEYEKEIGSVPDRLSSSELTELTGFSVPDSFRIGSLYTERWLCRAYPKLEICLDKVKYYDVTEYELELEYTGDYPEEAVELLKSKGIEFEKESVGKFHRFLSYRKLKNKM